MNWGPYIFYLLIVLIAADRRFGWFDRFSRSSHLAEKIRKKITYKALILMVLFFKILYALIETFGQYYVWSENAFTKLLLERNVVDFNALKQFSGKLFVFLNNRFGYFIFYSWGRFWMEIAASLVAAASFYLFLIFLKKYRERFFEEGETELGFLLALIVGWSNFIIFLPIAFLCVIIISVFRMLIFKEAYTTLGAPFILAAFIVLLFGGYLISALGLTSFKV